MRLLIKFNNGHVFKKDFLNAPQAYQYANNNVSLTGGRIQSIVLDTGQGLRDLWALHWDTYSQIKGMKLPC